MKSCSFCGTQNNDDATTCVRCRVGMLDKGASRVGTMKSLVEARRFKNLAEDFLSSVGAVKGTDEKYPLQIETTVGTLMLNPVDVGVNGQFQDVKRARALLHPKKYHWDGRWLHNYYQSPMSAKQAVDDLKKNLLPLLPQSGYGFPIPPLHQTAPQEKMSLRIHLLLADPARTACGRDSASTTADVADVTCRNCLNQIEIRAQAPYWEPPFYSKVAGVSHPNQDGSSRQAIIGQCRIGEGLSLVREPANPADPNAIKLLRTNGEQVGYITGYVASDLAHHIDKGGIVKCRISDLTGGGDKWRGANIEISRWTGHGEPEAPLNPVTTSTSSPTFSMAALTLPASAPHSPAPSTKSASMNRCSVTSRKPATEIPWAWLVILLVVIAVFVLIAVNK